MSDPTQPDEIWAVFAGPIDAHCPNRFMQGITTAMSAGVKHIHLLFHSHGGNVGDGICLYNLFAALPIRLTIYNVGNVSSAATIAYLGAKERKTSAFATFMLHRTQAVPQSATADRLHALAHSVVIDDDRTEAILRKHLTLPDNKWAVHKVADLWFSAEDAVSCGLSTSIGEFRPPIGANIYNV